MWDVCFPLPGEVAAVVTEFGSQLMDIGRGSCNLGFWVDRRV